LINFLDERFHLNSTENSQTQHTLEIPSLLSYEIHTTPKLFLLAVSKNFSLLLIIAVNVTSFLKINHPHSLAYLSFFPERTILHIHLLL